MKQCSAWSPLTIGAVIKKPWEDTWRPLVTKLTGIASGNSTQVSQL